ncbi:hypothetical protein PCE1_004195 [Barthelona sp. PCE]
MDFATLFRRGIEEKLKSQEEQTLFLRKANELIEFAEEDAKMNFGIAGAAIEIFSSVYSKKIDSLLKEASALQSKLYCSTEVDEEDDEEDDSGEKSKEKAKKSRKKKNTSVRNLDTNKCILTMEQTLMELRVCDPYYSRLAQRLDQTASGGLLSAKLLFEDSKPIFDLNQARSVRDAAVKQRMRTKLQGLSFETINEEPSVHIEEEKVKEEVEENVGEMPVVCENEDIGIPDLPDMPDMDDLIDMEVTVPQECTDIPLLETQAYTNLQRSADTVDSNSDGLHRVIEKKRFVEGLSSILELDTNEYYDPNFQSSNWAGLTSWVHSKNKKRRRGAIDTVKTKRSKKETKKKEKLSLSFNLDTVLELCEYECEDKKKKKLFRKKLKKVKKIDVSSHFTRNLRISVNNFRKNTNGVSLHWHADRTTTKGKEEEEYTIPESFDVAFGVPDQYDLPDIPDMDVGMDIVPDIADYENGEEEEISRRKRTMVGQVILCDPVAVKGAINVQLDEKGEEPDSFSSLTKKIQRIVPHCSHANALINLLIVANERHLRLEQIDGTQIIIHK